MHERANDYGTFEQEMALTDIQTNTGIELHGQKQSIRVEHPIRVTMYWGIRVTRYIRGRSSLLGSD